MVKGVLHYFLNVREVRDHAILVQLFGLAINHNNPIVAVQIFTFALIRQHQIMRRGDFYSFFYVIHKIIDDLTIYDLFTIYDLLDDLVVIDCFVLNAGLRERFLSFTASTADTAMMFSAFVATPCFGVVKVQFLAACGYFRFGEVGIGCQ